MKLLLICGEMFLRWTSVVLYFVVLVSLSLFTRQDVPVPVIGTIICGLIGVLGVVFARIPIVLIYLLFLLVVRTIAHLPTFIADLIMEACDWAIDYMCTIRAFLFSTEDTISW